MRTEYTYQVGDQARKVVVEREGDCFRVTVGDRAYSIRGQRPEHGRLNLQVGERRLRAHVAGDGQRRYVALDGQIWLLERPRPAPRRRGPGADSGTLEAAMPGLVLDVLVKEEDVVERGDTLVLLEAMKMELRISAPASGRVRRVHCQAGQIVERGQLLVEIEENPAEA